MNAAFSMLVLIAGCTAAIPVDERTDRENTACDAFRYQGMIGRPFAVLNAAVLPSATRIIRREWL